MLQERGGFVLSMTLGFDLKAGGDSNREMDSISVPPCTASMSNSLYRVVENERETCFRWVHDNYALLHWSLPPPPPPPRPETMPEEGKLASR